MVFITLFHEKQNETIVITGTCSKVKLKQCLANQTKKMCFMLYCQEQSDVCVTRFKMPSLAFMGIYNRGFSFLDKGK